MIMARIIENSDNAMNHCDHAKKHVYWTVILAWSWACFRHDDGMVAMYMQPREVLIRKLWKFPENADNFRWICWTSAKKIWKNQNLKGIFFENLNLSSYD